MGISYLDYLRQMGMGGALLGGDTAVPQLSGLPPITPLPTPGFSSEQVANMQIPNPRIEGSGLGGALLRASTGTQNAMTRLGGSLFPVDPTIAASMTPEQIQQTQQQGLLRAGLGLLNAPRGATTGQAIAGALLGAQQDTQQQAMQRYALGQQASNVARQDQRYNQERTDKLAQQSTENIRNDRELQGRLSYWKGQIDTQRLAAQRYGQASPTEMAKLAAEEQRYQRAIELIRKPQLTQQDKYELDFLTSGAVSRTDRADPFGGAGGPGGAAGPTPEEIARGLP